MPGDLGILALFGYLRLRSTRQNKCGHEARQPSAWGFNLIEQIHEIKIQGLLKKISQNLGSFMFYVNCTILFFVNIQAQF